MSDPTPAKRLSLSQIVELLLTRSSGERSAVTLTRNAKGETQIEVHVRTGDSGDVLTVEDAEQRATDAYDRLRAKYPAANGHDESAVTLTRNAKGETQIEVTTKTSDAGLPTIDAAADAVRKVYDATRAKYPMADGHTAKPGSVA